jgi:alkylated DNA repair dioxygenase AlkB
MLFTSAQGSQLAGSTSGFPTYLQELSSTLEDLLAPHLDKDTMSTLFHPFSANASSRQIILNLYRPGEGITPHIDLPGRYADGIMGVCLGSGCVMDFERPETSEVASKYSVYMPARTIYCMTGDARWKWAHGIPSRDRDVVADAQGQIRTILRDVRISITLRWMKPGAEVLQ